MTIDLELRAAARSLLKSPGYLATAMLSLALGIGAGAAAFGVLDAVRFRALPFPDPDRLVVLGEVPEKARECTGPCDVSYEVYANLLRVSPPKSVDVVAAFTSGGKAFSQGGDPILVTGGIASPNLFELLQVRPHLGRGLLAEDDRLGVPLVAVLSHAFWTNHLDADPRIIGKDIKLSDSHYTVVGVMPPGFEHEVGSQFWLPVVPTLDPSTRPSIRSVTVIARLAPGRTLEQLRSELGNLDPAALAGGRQEEPSRLLALPLRSRYADSTQSHDLIFAAIVGCVLLIACANLANLSLVRALGQQRELALRSALGARPGRLAAGMMAQHALVVLPAALLGVLFASWLLSTLQSLSALQSLRPPGMEYRLDARVGGFAFLLALLIGVLLSVVSSRAVARGDAQRLLQDGAASAGGRGRRGSRAQQVFVVVQVASAVAMLTGAGLLARTAYRLAGVDLGFDAAHLIQGTPSFPHPWRVKEKYLPVSRDIVRGLGLLPGVRSVAIRADVPLRDSLVRRAISVGPGYFKTLGIELWRGREFGEQDLESAAPVAIVNQWAARHWWPGGDAIGRTLRVDTAQGKSATLTVVGVVRDNHAADRSYLVSEPGPELYRPYEQAASAFPSFYLQADRITGELLRSVRMELARQVPDRPLFASLVSDDVARQMARIKLNAIQILSFAAVGLGLALLGISGVLGYTVRRRTQEIGIRGALGASRGEVERMVLGSAARLTLAGIALGLPAAALASKLIEGMLYGTSRTDPLVYGGVALIVAVVALAAAYLPARRAARINPVIALRN